MIEITGGDYRVSYDPSAGVVTFKGVLRLYGTDGYVSIQESRKSHQASQASSDQITSGGYTSIMKLLTDIAAQAPEQITLDLKELQFLNSSGVNMLSKFTIMIRKQRVCRLVILGNPKRSWQQTIIKNLKRLMPEMTVTLDEE